MKIAHYYHVYAGGAWATPVRDHLTAMGRAGLDDLDLIIGLVGPEHDRVMARERIRELCRKWVLPAPQFAAEADDGWEQVTLRLIHQDVHRDPGERAVLYMHTKGASNNTDASATWRRAMTAQLVGQWEECVRHLEQGCDAVGCHWIKAPEWPEQVPFFAGNFWWARAGYLRTLGEPPNETRWTAEVWASGDGSPRVHDMLPGYPSYNDI